MDCQSGVKTFQRFTSSSGLRMFLNFETFGTLELVTFTHKWNSETLELLNFPSPKKITA